MSAAAARASIAAAAVQLADDDVVLLARLLALGSREELRLELRKVPEADATTPGRWLKVLTLGALDALAGRRR